jgi:uncharacterized protein with PIN domain
MERDTLLKDMGRERTKRIEYTRCIYCKKKINIQQAMDDGYIEKVANCTIIICPHCQKEFND